MQQEINLYTLLPKRTGMYLTKRTVLSTYAVLLIILLIMYIYMVYQKNKSYKNYLEVNQQVVALNSELEKLTIKYPISNPNDLSGSVKKAREDYESKLNILTELTPNLHFAENFLALANAYVPGVWITKIELSRREPYLLLNGHMLQTILLKEFLAQLAKQPIFQNLNFEPKEIMDTKIPADFYIVSEVKDD